LKEFLNASMTQIREKDKGLNVYDEKRQSILNVVPFSFPPRAGEILSKKKGFVYFEYQLDRDKEFIQSYSKNFLMIYSFGNIILFLIIIYFIFTRIINRILEISKGTKAISHGYLDYRLEYDETKSQDEISQLSNSFNEMGESLSDKENKVQVAYEALKQKANEAKKANLAKSDFLANMSHEIRTPLNAMLGFITLLQKDEHDPERLNYFNIVNEASTNLLGIINDILDFSKIESGKLEIDLYAFDPQKEFGTIFELYRHKAEEKSIDFNLTIDKRMPEVIIADPLRLKQVIANLLSNAVKFSKRQGQISMSIFYDTNKKQLKVDVTDDGIGIEQSKQKNIFNAFVQSDSTITRKYGGTGLGLSISYQLIEMMGGKLSFSSVYNEGSTFSFYLPVTIGEKTAIDKVEGIVTFSKQKVLLVEDNKSNQMLMTILLNDFNLSHEIANDGQEAVDKFQTGHYDIILMDENMPKMNGIEATKQIRVIESQTKAAPTPIIALTANALKGDKERFLASGMDEYLSKPIDKMKLQAMLKHFIFASQRNKEAIQTLSVADVKRQNLVKLFNLSNEDVDELLELFYDSAKKYLKNLQKAIRLSDYDGIRTSAHTIQGSALNLRLDEIVKIALIVEEAARNSENIDYEWYYEQLVYAIEKVH
ncbi:MAG: ATP-binding protein, partial [Thiovulaceae bacterium]|nr:ATP-binding protein [Sulfurimonadaceae bacterium]